MALPIPKKDLVIMAMVAVLTAAISLYFFSGSTTPGQVGEAAEFDGQGQVQQEAQIYVPLPVETKDVLGYESKHGSLPSAMVDTKLRMVLAVDEQGNLRVSSDIKEIFDYFLSNIEEEELDVILARINEYLSHHLEEPAIGQATTILEQYIGYKNALLGLEEQMASNLSLEGLDKHNLLAKFELQMTERNALRQEYLSPEVFDAFYAEQQAYDDYTLGKLKVISNTSLSEAQKQQQIEVLESMLPEHQLALRNQNKKLHNLRDETAELKKTGASSDQIQSLRTEYYGEEAAQRFAKLDQERAEWDQRVQAYMAQRASILDNSGLANDEKEAQINSLRSEHFDSREQIRVSYFERRG